MTALTAVFAPGDFIDITLADDEDAQMKSCFPKCTARLEERLASNLTPGIIVEMGKYFDLGDILEEEETVEVGERQSRSLKIVDL